MARFQHITIVGLGLIGGSLGMAIKRRRLAGRVVGLSRSASTARHAKLLGAVDEGTTNAQDAVRDADLVVLATPVETIVPLGRRLARWMRPGTILTDVGSTKSAIVTGLRSLPRRITFVGGHPIAGSERHGLAAADPDLFRGSVCIITPTASTPRAAQARVAALWKPLVGRVVRMTPDRHDRLMAQTSHLAHVLAFTLSQAGKRASSPIVSRSFLDATRVAKSDPSLWDDIFLTNRREILRAMDAYAQEWRRMKRMLTRSDRAGLLKFLVQAKRFRDGLDE